MRNRPQFEAKMFGERRNRSTLLSRNRPQKETHLTELKQFVFVKVKSILLGLLSCLPFGLQTGFPSFSKTAEHSPVKHILLCFSDHLLCFVFHSSFHTYYILQIMLDLLCGQVIMYCTLNTSLEIWVLLMMQFLYFHTIYESIES